MPFLISKCFFTIGNNAFEQDIGTPMGIDPAPSWTNFFLYEFKYIKQLISNGPSEAYKYSWVSRFIDDLYAINDGSEFLKLFKNIYPKELEFEHQGNHASFSDLDIKIEDSVFDSVLQHKR